ncbi:MAG: sel1 repeat family protein [bacterium]|nr:sel1 repeat family protein [bacterium]
MKQMADGGDKDAISAICSGDYSFNTEKYSISEDEDSVIRSKTLCVYDRALNGDNEAQLAVGFAFSDVSYQNPPKVFKTDLSESFYWINKAALNENTSAECALGYYLMKGMGCKRDYSKGLMWLRRTADKGNASAIYRLGVAYASGDGVIQDWDKAVELYKEADLKGLRSAAFLLDCVLFTERE